MIDGLINNDIYGDPDPETVFMWDLIMTARWMHIDPEVLADKSLFWLDWGLTCMAADQALQREQERAARMALQKHGR